MVRKAVKIFHSKVDSIDTMLSILNGQKISAFFLNIYQQENSMVTVDSWIALASNGKYLPVEKRPSMKKSEFKEISEVITELSEVYNLKPYQTQAVIWVYFKRQHEESFNKIKSA